MIKILIAVGSCLIFSSCTWVKVTTKGEGVRLVHSAKAVQPCKKIGRVETKVVSKIVFNRNQEKVADELACLAPTPPGR